MYPLFDLFTRNNQGYGSPGRIAGNSKLRASASTWPNSERDRLQLSTIVRSESERNFLSSNEQRIMFVGGRDGTEKSRRTTYTLIKSVIAVAHEKKEKVLWYDDTWKIYKPPSSHEGFSGEV